MKPTEVLNSYIQYAVVDINCVLNKTRHFFTFHNWHNCLDKLALYWCSTGKMASPFVAPYTSTKFALNGFFGALYHELAMKKSNASISICTLGLIDTDSAMEKVRLVKSMLKWIWHHYFVICLFPFTLCCPQWLSVVFFLPFLSKGNHWCTSLPRHKCSLEYHHYRSNKTTRALLPLDHLPCDSKQRLVSFYHKLFHPEHVQVHPVIQIIYLYNFCVFN